MVAFCANKLVPITEASSRPTYHKTDKAYSLNLASTLTPSLSWLQMSQQWNGVMKWITWLKLVSWGPKQKFHFGSIVSASIVAFHLHLLLWHFGLETFGATLLSLKCREIGMATMTESWHNRFVKEQGISQNSRKTKLWEFQSEQWQLFWIFILHIWR